MQTKADHTSPNRMDDPKANEALNAPEQPNGELDVISRREQILAQLKYAGRVRVSDLSRTFSVSEVTIRADLDDLDRQGLLSRVHGGAIKSNHSYDRMDTNERKNINVAQKRDIAAAAAKLINDGETIFIGSGTTTHYMVEHLRKLNRILLLTNSINIALEMDNVPSVQVVLVGGMYETQYRFTYGRDAINQINKYHADKNFLPCDGVHAVNGITTYHTLAQEVSQAFIENSDLTITIADYSKIGRISRLQVCPLDLVDILITNASDSLDLQTLRQTELEIIEV